ncbi:MAG: hypothetical protein ABIO46_15740, partial [Chitinophagales bacterium]
LVGLTPNPSPKERGATHSKPQTPAKNNYQKEHPIKIGYNRKRSNYLLPGDFQTQEKKSVSKLTFLEAAILSFGEGA